MVFLLFTIACIYLQCIHFSCLEYINHVIEIVLRLRCQVAISISGSRHLLQLLLQPPAARLTTVNMGGDLNLKK
jgi:hypothetical protein